MNDFDVWYAQLTFIDLKKSTNNKADIVCICKTSNDFHRLVLEHCAKSEFEIVKISEKTRLLEKFAKEGYIAHLAKASRQLSTNCPVVFQEVLNPQYEPKNLLTPILDELSVEEIFAKATRPIWAIVDAINCPSVLELAENNLVRTIPLYSAANPEILATSPWLIEVDQRSSFVGNWLFELSNLVHWGYLFESSWSMDEIRKYLRKFTMITVPDASEMPVYFRFYDPRVFVDIFQNLENDKLSKLCAPFQMVYVPVSPEHCIETQNSEANQALIFAQESDLAGQFYRLSLDHLSEDKGQLRGGLQFEIDPQTYGKLSQAQHKRSSVRLMRELREMYPQEVSNDAICEAVISAPILAQEFGFKSRNQVLMLARCNIEYGINFEKKYSLMGDILKDQKTVAWRRSRDLELQLRAPKNGKIEMVKGLGTVQEFIDKRQSRNVRAIF